MAAQFSKPPLWAGVLLVFCLLPLFYLYFDAALVDGKLPFLPKQHVEAQAVETNSTLGFGAVLAVSHATSPRRKELIFSANLTGIDITIPDQPKWTDKDIDAFKSPEKSRIKKGSALAWMGHLNALRWFLSTDLETALILEDDVDWDINLRPKQIPLAASAIRQLLANATSVKHPSSLPKRDIIPSAENTTYWGPLSWEILYLGHCGDLSSNDTLLTKPYITYQDASLPAPSDLHPKTSAFLRQLSLPPHTRLAHPSHWPLCTFAYAVTRASAQRILRTFPNEGPRGCQAFDVRILEACRDQGWACYTINPELFHHVSAPSEIANVDQGKVGEVDEFGRLKRREGRTPNLGCGVRRRGFWTDDQGTLGWLKEWLGKGECLVDDMEGDMGRLS